MKASKHFYVGLVIGASVLLGALWLSVGPDLAQGQQQRNCVADLFQKMQQMGIAVNLPKDQKDFETDRDNAKAAIQKAIKAGTLAAGTDTQFTDSVETISCHLVDTATWPLVKAEQDRRLTEAVAKLRNLFQRIANPAAGADDLKDWLAKLFFLGPKNFFRFSNAQGQYIWNLVRLELVLNQNGAAQEPGVFAIPATGTDVDLVLLGRRVITPDVPGKAGANWGCGVIGRCSYGFGVSNQDGLFFIQIKDIANANNVLFTQQGGQQVAGGLGTLQHYTEIVLKHIGGNAANWRNLYNQGQLNCMIPAGVFPRLWPMPCGILPKLPELELIIGIAFWGMPQNADKVKQEITGLGLAAGQALNAAQQAVQAALNAETKGLVVGWTALVQQKTQIQYSCAAVDRKTKVWTKCDAQAAIAANNPLQYFSPVNAKKFVCNSYGQALMRCGAQEK